MSLRKTVKNFSPSIQKFIKHLYGLTPIRIRYGKDFWDTYNFLEKSQWWDKEKLEQYQIEQLKRLLGHAYRNVPYYKKVFTEYGIKPEKINCIDDFKKIPYLTKEIVKNNSLELTATNYNKKDLYIAHTSGTTGKPMQWYVSLSENQKEYAFICHQWSRMGFYPGDRIVQIRGTVLEDNKVFDFDPITNVLRLSPKLISKKTAENYIKLINDFGAKFLHGYPSIISVFASIIKENKLVIPFNLKSVFFASEAVYPWEKKLVEEVFNCRVFSHYGMAEKVVLAGECEKTINYHSIPQYGITEMDNNEIIGTSFIDYVTPFIRYRTTDIVEEITGNNDLICDCKRQYFPVFKRIEGRLVDFIITPDGGYISPTAITHTFNDFLSIKETQLIQHSLHLLEVKVVPYDNISRTMLDKELQKIKEELISIIGKDIKVKTTILKELELTKSGKFRWIISKISNNSLEKGL